ncbi:hypothetical protein EI546_09870 [Aequorivita sp. H23M31]|uniref:Uncharacterized protein n=1 Tax=Aequorivita ciconiae TaxID=2494375 RepID=A0A410G413_9FLAO|nr:hypothetical protein [Aequorivita sp. H23M31]QAA82010.1 hypothetical protein EI546_09870 [Aequorivita sp. H23M31]
MNRLITNKKLTIINFVIVTYFVLLWLINVYNLDFVLIGVFRELLTIPFLLAQIIFLIIGVRFLLKNETQFWTIAILIILGICALLTIGSFF